MTPEEREQRDRKKAYEQQNALRHVAQQLSYETSKRYPSQTRINKLKAELERLKSYPGESNA